MAKSATPEPNEPLPAWAQENNTQRTCIACTQTDNHPKVQVGPLDQPPAFWHFDCHAIATGDPHSQAVVDQSGGLQGHALRVFLHGDPDEGSSPSFDPTQVQEAV